MPTIQTIMNREKARNQAVRSTRQWPSNIGQHYILFEFFDYRTENSTGVYALPTPENLQDSTALNVGSVNLGSMGKAFEQFLSSDGVNDMEGKVMNAMMDAVSGIYNSGKALGSEGGFNISGLLKQALSANRFYTRSAIDSVIEGGSTAIDVALGNTVNPHATLNFDGVNLKAHSFSWTLSPKDEAEAIEIRDLITDIKVRSLPRYEAVTSAGDIGRQALLQYPDKVQISFGPGMNKDHYYGGVIKTAMVTNIAANYAPNGLAINSGRNLTGVPAATSLSIDFMEMEIHTKEDYVSED